MTTKGSLRLNALIEQAKSLGISKTKIARAMGITPAHLSNLLSGRNEWRISQIENLCYFLRISIAEAFLDPGDDVELFVLLKRIIDAGPEPYHAIAWNLHGIVKQIEDDGPNINSRASNIFRKRNKSVKDPGKKTRVQLPLGFDTRRR